MQAVTGNTPLHMAVLHGNEKMTSQMVSALQENGGNVDIPNSNGDTVRSSNLPALIITTLLIDDN
jgi:ankyrin repeat protein